MRRRVGSIVVVLAFLVLDVVVGDTNIWMQLPDMPVPLMHYGISMATGLSAGDENNIYFYGKPWDKWENYMHKFDTVAESWTVLSANTTTGTGINPRWFQSGLMLRDGSFWIFAGVEFAGMSNGIPTGKFLKTINNYNFGKIVEA